MTRRGISPSRAAGVLAIIAALSACSHTHTVGISRRADTSGASPTPSASVLPPVTDLTRPALLITQDKPFTAAELTKVRRLRGVTRTALIGYGEVWVYDQQVPTAAVDPDAYRPFTPAATADSAPVWAAVDRGDGLISHEAGIRDRLPLQATIPAGWSMLRVAGYATTVPGIDLVVSVQAGQRIGVPFGTGLIVAATGDPADLALRARRSLGAKALVRTIVKPAKTAAPGSTPGPILPVITPSVPATSAVPSVTHRPRFRH